MKKLAVLTLLFVSFQVYSQGFSKNGSMGNPQVYVDMNETNDTIILNGLKEICYAFDSKMIFPIKNNSRHLGWQITVEKNENGETLISTYCCEATVNIQIVVKEIKYSSGTALEVTSFSVFCPNDDGDGGCEFCGNYFLAGD